MSRSRLQPDSATTVGLLTAIGVYLIYNNALPNLTDVRVAAPHDEDVDKERKYAAIKSAVLIGGVFLVARDFNSYVISGAALVGIDWMYKHANSVQHGSVDMGSHLTLTDDARYAMPSYADDAS